MVKSSAIVQHSKLILEAFNWAVFPNINKYFPYTKDTRGSKVLPVFLSISPETVKDSKQASKLARIVHVWLQFHLQNMLCSNWSLHGHQREKEGENSLFGLMLHEVIKTNDVNGQDRNLTYFFPPPVFLAWSVVNTVLLLCFYLS